MDEDLNKTWLEPVLSEHLRPVAAPRELWNRVQPQVKPARPRNAAWRLGLIAVATLLVAGTSAILKVRAANPMGLSLQSASAPEIQAWVKENAGLDVPLPARMPEPVRLSGAHVGPNGVEVDYFVRNRPERLLISRSDARSSSQHQFLERGLKKVSWTMSGQLYTAEDAQAACLLCHS
jgi:hypothetical protein